MEQSYWFEALHSVTVVVEAVEQSVFVVAAAVVVPVVAAVVAVAVVEVAVVSVVWRLLTVPVPVVAVVDASVVVVPVEASEAALVVSRAARPDERYRQQKARISAQVSADCY